MANYDDWKTTEPEPYATSRVSPRLQFKFACEGLLRAMGRASVPGISHVDDTFHEAEAVWFAKHVASEARRLGLIPAPIDVRVLVEMDVLAGELVD